MKTKEMEQMALEILSGVAEWRGQHPKATLVEIEQEVMKRMVKLQARMMAEIAQASEMTDWGDVETPKCPECGARMEKQGKRKRRLQASGGADVELERAYAKCPACGVVFFPLDEELELLPGHLTPHSHESLVRLGAWMPFEQAVGMLSDVLGVEVSKSTGRRYTQAAGAAYVAMQNEEAERIEREAPKPVAESEKLVLSADGAMVPLLRGEWAEVKTLAIGEVVSHGDEPEVQVKNISYFSRLTNARQFEHLTLSEIHRRGVENSRQVAAVMDGAQWLQNLVDYHCPDAIRILDFPHAGQRLGEIAQAIWGDESDHTRRWTEKQLHRLKHDGPQAVLERLRLLAAHDPHLETIPRNLAYLEKRTDQMQYPHFKQQGWPIGSGMVESANKLVVESRLKGAGMHWKRENVDPMLALRNIVCSHRWEQEWPKITQRLRQERKQRRQSLHKQRQPPQEKTVPHPENSAPSTKRAETIAPTAPLEPQKQHPERAVPWRPPANHPWRRSPIGRARYQPSFPTKK